MKRNPLPIAAGLVLWGFSVGQALLGTALAAAAFGAPWVRHKITLPGATIQRLIVALNCVSIATVVGLGVQRGLPDGLYAAFTWLPLIWMPLLLLEAVSTVPLQFGHFMARARRLLHDGPEVVVTLRGPFVALTLLSASVAQTDGAWFFASATGVLCAWLYTDAPRQGWRQTLGFLVCALVATACAWSLGAGLRSAQNATQDLFVSVFSSTDNNPYKSHTRIGDLGQIKLSEQIVWRAQLTGALQAPVLLRSGVFTRYADGQWLARRGNFVPTESQAGPGTALLRLWGRGESSGLLLPLPMLASTFAGTDDSHTAVGNAERNEEGIVRLTQTPPILDVQAWAGEHQVMPAPDATDLSVAKPVRQWVTRVPELNAVQGESDATKLAATQDWFAANFKYTLYLGDDAHAARDLERFMFADRAGHCEYFATATVLLLRAQGIPARYVTGYALQEYSNWEHAYIVRLSHAHAWVQAYVNGRWVEVDTTPSTWAAEEEKHASVLQPVWDVISYLAFRLSQGMQQVGLRSYAGLALVIAVSAALYGWVRFRRRAVPRSGSKKATGLAGKAARTSPSLTEFGALEREWEARGWARRPHETPRAWLNRVSTQGAGAHTAEQLSRLATVVNALYLSSYGKSTMHNDQDLRP